MRSSLVGIYFYCACCWVLLLTAATVTTASTASPSPRPSRGFWGRSSSSTAAAANTTTIDQDETTIESDKGNDDHSVNRGLFYRFQGKPSSQETSEEEGGSGGDGDTVNDDKKLEKETENESSTRTKVTESSTATTTNSTTTTTTNSTSVSPSEKSKVVDIDDAQSSPPAKKRGRGPFGLFKPVEEIKKTKIETEETSQDAEQQESNPFKQEASGADEEDANKQEDETVAQKGAEEDKSKEEESDATTNTTQATDAPSKSLPRPRVFVYRPPSGLQPQSRPLPAQYGGRGGPPSQASPFAPQMDHQALITATVVSLVNVASRLWLIVWLAKRLSAEDELLIPEQHFRWECLNDRYSKDETVLSNVFGSPPLGFSRLRWRRHMRKVQPKKSSTNPTKGGPKLPTKNVVVVDITPSGYIEMPYITDVVNFLVASYTKSQFGSDPEIVLLVESPGGSVSLFGLAAAQVGRLKQMGWNVTICVDSVAASGGYMIAAQATKLIGAPFAQLGSIGVMAEGLNFNDLLTKYGVKPLVLKAGDEKNRLSTFGPVTDTDLQTETKRLEKIHEAFIEMCLRERPNLDPGICDGTVMVAAQGFDHGLVDRVLTSEEYIWECIQDGAHVLKLHKASPRAHPNYILFRALDVLPHLKHKLQSLDAGKLLSMAIQGSAFVGMVLRAIR